MFSLGFGEIVIICLILIVVVGPERLPSVMKSVGKTMRTVRQASRDLRETVGLDELMREDVLRPMPPRRPPPATISRTDDSAATPPATPATPATETPSPAPEVANAKPDGGAVDARVANPQPGAEATDPAGERKA